MTNKLDARSLHLDQQTLRPWLTAESGGGTFGWAVTWRDASGPHTPRRYFFLAGPGWTVEREVSAATRYFNPQEKGGVTVLPSSAAWDILMQLMEGSGLALPPSPGLARRSVDDHIYYLAHGLVPFLLKNKGEYLPWEDMA